ncbi:hypothetical protein Tco_0248203 [Tanacetum coccineum]
MDGSVPTKELAFIANGTGYKVKSIGKGLLGPRGESSGGKGRGCGDNGGRGGGKSAKESKNACGEVGGVKKMSSTGSKFVVRGEECLEGCVGAGEGKVNGGGDEFRESKSLLGEIPRVAIRESGGETFRVYGGVGEIYGKKLCLKFKIRVYNSYTVLPVLPVPFAEWNRLCFSMEPETPDVAETM